MGGKDRPYTSAAGHARDLHFPPDFPRRRLHGAGLSKMRFIIIVAAGVTLSATFDALIAAAAAEHHLINIDDFGAVGRVPRQRRRATHYRHHYPHRRRPASRLASNLRRVLRQTRH